MTSRDTLRIRTRGLSQDYFGQMENTVCPGDIELLGRLIESLNHIHFGGLIQRIAFFSSRT